MLFHLPLLEVGRRGYTRRSFFYGLQKLTDHEDQAENVQITV